MTTPITVPQDPGPLPLPAPEVVRTPATFETPIAEWGGKVRAGLQTLIKLLSPGGLLGTGGRLEQSYVKDRGGIPESDLSPTVREALERARAMNLVELRWEGDLNLVRPTSDPNIKYIWAQWNPAHLPPPTDETHAMAGVDYLWVAG